MDHKDTNSAVDEQNNPNNQNNQNEKDDTSLSTYIESWPNYTLEERKEIFRDLSRMDAEELFLNLSAQDQAELMSETTLLEKRSWIKLLAPDDAADLLQALDNDDDRKEMMSLLDENGRREVMALMAYAEDNAGGLMNPRFVRLRPDMLVDEAIRYLRIQAKTQVETIYSAYVIDDQKVLKGVVSFRELLCAPPGKKIKEIMETDLVMAPEDLDQEKLGRLFNQHDLMTIPVVDRENRIKGIVTIDDIVDVVQEEATEDIQKFGGVEALDAPYLKISLGKMVKKRAGWLLMLFFGEMLTATAMGFYTKEIEKAVVLALFIPLIISSGGNSGSQASTLIIRAMALGEVRLKDWSIVLGRELLSGMTLGLILGVCGLIKVLFLPPQDSLYHEQVVMIALTVSFSLVCVVLWGTIAGSMLPFILRFFRLDPATASAPFVATLVDVTGLVIYFSFASMLLRGLFF